MARVRFLPKAIDDLADVWRYTVDRWSVEQAVGCKLQYWIEIQ